MNPLRKIDDYLMELGEKQRRLAARNRALKTVDQMTPRQFNRRIEAQMPVQVDEMPLADRLLQMEKTNTLVNNRLDRLTPDQQMRSLPLIARDYQDALRQSRMADEAARQAAMDKAVAVWGPAGAAAASLAGIGIANAIPEEEPGRAPLTLEDVARMRLEPQNLDLTQAPEDVLPFASVDLGDFPGRFMDEYRGPEAGVYVDPEFDAEGLLEMIAADQQAPVIPPIEDMLSVDDDPLAAGLLSDAPADDLPEPITERDPYMTRNQKLAAEVLIDAGVPPARAGQIVRGETPMSPEEQLVIRGGR